LSQGAYGIAGETVAARLAYQRVGDAVLGVAVAAADGAALSLSRRL
jgi:hypothetical protein